MWLLPYVQNLWAPYVPPPGDSNIELLPLVKATAGFANDEDIILGFTALANDGVSPLSLANINWTATFTTAHNGQTKATLSSLGSSPGIVLSGADENVLTITILAPAPVWNYGVYSLRLLANDGVNTKEVFTLSSITIGPPAPLFITTIRGQAPRGVLTPL